MRLGQAMGRKQQSQLKRARGEDKRIPRSDSLGWLAAIESHGTNFVHRHEKRH